MAIINENNIGLDFIQTDIKSSILNRTIKSYSTVQTNDNTVKEDNIKQIDSYIPEYQPVLKEIIKQQASVTQTYQIMDKNPDATVTVDKNGNIVIISNNNSYVNTNTNKTNYSTLGETINAYVEGNTKQEEIQQQIGNPSVTPDGKIIINGSGNLSSVDQKELSGQVATSTTSDNNVENNTSSQGESQTLPENPNPTSAIKEADEIEGIIKENQFKIGNIVNKQINVWKKDAESETINYSQRVSLNITPINKENNISSSSSSAESEKRATYILGSSGLLYDLFKPTKGIVFQYTPSITMGHSVNYEQTDILHSNLAVQHYKNTPPPTITLKADFTADSNDNAKYMYGVLCFLRAMTKCEFGEEVVNKRENNQGIPPPVLYLNGWGNMINNVPVVITGFDIDLPKDKHYVKLENENIWLPTEMSFNIQLKIQFNLNKYKHQFDLEKYKEGILNNVENITKGSSLSYFVSGSKSALTDIETAVRFNGSGWTW